MAKLNFNPFGKGEIMSEGGRVTARKTTQEVRDYMWTEKDATSTWGPGWKTNREIWDDVISRRGASTSTQAIRRSLNWLVEQGLLEKDSGQEPEIFRWNPTKPFPGTPPQKPAANTLTGMVHGTILNAPLILMNTPNIPVTTFPTVTPKSRREELHDLLEAKVKEKNKPAAKKPPRKGIIRKNGQVYLPRSLGGQNISDVDALRKLRGAMLFPLLYGPPGSGKSVLPEATFADELVIFEGNEDSGVDDLVGTYTQTSDGWVWADGPALIAAKQGRPLFLDDMTLVSPKVLAALYPLMDGRREIWVPQHMVKQAEIDAGTVQPHNIAGRPEHVKAADGFWVVGAHNPGVHGAILTDALRSRFTVTIEVETDLELVAELKVPEKFVRLARNLRTKQRNNDIQWTPQLRELLAARDTSALFGEELAAANLAGVAPEEDRDVVLDMLRAIWGSDIKPLNLRGQI